MLEKMLAALGSMHSRCDLPFGREASAAGSGSAGAEPHSPGMELLKGLLASGHSNLSSLEPPRWQPQ